MIEILEAAESKQLVSLTDLKTALEITTSDDDDLLNLLLDAASQTIVDYTGREFARERVLETLPGYGDTNLLLSRAYVDTINSVLHSGEAIVDFIISDAEAGILYRARAWDWTAGIGFSLTARPIAGTEEPRFAINYYGGYWLSSFTGTKPDEAKDLPASIAQACIDTVHLWYTQRKSDIVAGTESIRIGDYSVKYGSNNGSSGTNNALPTSVLGLLERWRRIA